ncbi:hypothetical protein DS893_19600 [Vibrionales bacterium C3R12]|nr:hypothetical protein DS893_19600 [Vibrionales bacterium C3R12]
MFTIITLPIALILKVIGSLISMFFGSQEARDTDRIDAITAEIDQIQNQETFSKDRSERSQKIRKARKQRLFTERKLLLAKYDIK